MKEYARSACKNADDLLFPISYEAARVIVAKAGKMVEIKLRPHDLRRHAATQRYLGKVSDHEAIRWIENLHG